MPQSQDPIDDKPKIKQPPVLFAKTQMVIEKAAKQVFNVYPNFTIEILEFSKFCFYFQCKKVK